MNRAFDQNSSEISDVFRQYLKSGSTIADEDIDTIIAASTPKKLRKHHHLLQAGDVCRQSAFVVTGCLRLYHVDEKGQEHIIHFSTEHMWMSDRESYTTGQPSQYNIDTLEPAQVLLWDKEKFDVLLRQIPAIREFKERLFAESFNAIQNRVHAGITFSAEEKYQDFIKKHPDLIHRVPLHMVASYLGITPVTLSRIRGQVAKK